MNCYDSVLIFMKYPKSGFSDELQRLFCFLQDILDDKGNKDDEGMIHKLTTMPQCVEEFVDKVLPLCWELATMFKPPIFKCDRNVQINGALHDFAHVSKRASTVKSCLFPLVYYGGVVKKKARVLAENC